ncbi:hypothetical protein [Shewanella algae]|uniref:hypothetical protein n=1 Tax=Shewanella algae TaxID=38313 RepID=UPI001AADEBB3|nr:hypothetical protein [Shewanella algae]MBO2658124.1 hypothetical protein [Shewanella algae]
MKKIVLVCLLAATSPANAFHINPSNKSNAEASSEGHFLDMISEPVHEGLTRSARVLFWEQCDGMSEIPSYCGSERKAPKTIYDSIIRGNWWADDPNQNLYKARQAVWLGYMVDAEKIAKSGKDTIDQTYKMHYRSHYGDMQFLHAMAFKDGVAAAETKSKIYMWMEFLYRMATGEIVSSTKFSDVKVKGIEHYFNRHQHWEVRWVMQPRYLLAHKNDFSEHALGAMLHLVQDSYSTSHVERVFEPTGKCQNGYINRFFSYSHQSSKKHGKSDTREGYHKTAYPKSSNPVTVGAQLIMFAKSKAGWESEVVPYLDSIVFCLSDSAMESGPGDFI